MDKLAILVVLDAQDAAEIYIAIDLRVYPDGPDMDQWRIGDLTQTDDELIGLVALHGVQPAADRVHQAVDVLPLRGKQLAALRAIAAAPGGMRLKAYPNAMSLLAEMGLMEQRAASRMTPRDGRAWFLTGDGHETVRAYARMRRECTSCVNLELGDARQRFNRLRLRPRRRPFYPIWPECRTAEEIERRCARLVKAPAIREFFLAEVSRQGQ